MTLGSRIGLFGGMFDPPHVGHVRFATAAVKKFSLAELFVVVTAVGPHRGVPPLFSFPQRVEMCEAAFAGIDGVSIADWEGHDSQPSYTADTVDRLVAHGYSDIVLLLGADQLVSFQSWKRWKDIITHVTLGVAVRETVPQNDIDTAAAELAAHGAIVELCPMEPTPVHSSTIRQFLQEGRVDAAKPMVAEQVWSQISAIWDTIGST